MNLWSKVPYGSICFVKKNVDVRNGYHGNKLRCSHGSGILMPKIAVVVIVLRRLKVISHMFTLQDVSANSRVSVSKKLFQKMNDWQIGRANRNKRLLLVRDQINIFLALCFQDTIVTRGHCSHHLLTVDVIKTNITSILHFNCIIPPTTQWYFQTFFKIHVFAIMFSKYKETFRKEYSVVTRYRQLAQF